MFPDVRALTTSTDVLGRGVLFGCAGRALLKVPEAVCGHVRKLPPGTCQPRVEALRNATRSPYVRRQLEV